MNLMGNTNDLILAYPAMEQVSFSQSVNVMLPPQFYTVKKEALPLRYAYQANKIAPSLFEGLLEEGRTYEYMVYKEEDEWVFLAYDIEKITAFLQSKGFALENIGKIFFAQQVAQRFEKPLLLGESDALVSLDGMIAVVPRGVLSDEQNDYQEFDNDFAPKKGVVLQGNYGSVLSKKQTLMLAAAFSLFAIIFFVEGSRYGANAQEGEAKMQELLEAYPSLQSKYTRESIVNKYKTIDRLERKKREFVKAISSIIFKGVTLNSLQIDAKTLKAQFTCKDAGVAKRVKALAKKNQLKILPVSGSNSVIVEGAL